MGFYDTLHCAARSHAARYFCHIRPVILVARAYSVGKRTYCARCSLRYIWIGPVHRSRYLGQGKWRIDSTLCASDRIRCISPSVPPRSRARQKGLRQASARTGYRPEHCHNCLSVLGGRARHLNWRFGTGKILDHCSAADDRATRAARLSRAALDTAPLFQRAFQRSIHRISIMVATYQHPAIGNSRFQPHRGGVDLTEMATRYCIVHSFFLCWSITGVNQHSAGIVF